jgi:hypothetical protein
MMAAKDDDAILEALSAKYAPKAKEAPAAVPVALQPTPAQEAPAAKPFQPDRAERLKQNIERSMLPEPDALSFAVSPTEIAGDLKATAAKIGDRATMGLWPKVDEAIGSTGIGRALGFSEPGSYAALEAERPVASSVAEVPAMAMSTLTGVPGKIGQAGAEAVRRTGLLASKAPQTLKTAAQAAAGSGLYGATDAAVRGASPGEVAEAALVSGAIGAGMGVAPAALGAIEGAAHRRALESAVKPITETAKKLQGKALTQFGGGEGKEMGAKELRSFVDREGLQPVLRSGPDMEKAFAAKQREVWQTEVEPVYAKAFEVNPKASVPMREIAGAIMEAIPADKRGTSYSRKMQAIVTHIKDGASDIPGAKSGLNYPLKNFYENVKEIQKSGYSGVVNYDDPVQAKEVARDAGNALRKLFNDRISRIYAANPKAARELMGQPESGYFQEGKTTPKTITDALINDPDVRAAGERLQAGNKRYSDYAKLQPLINDAAERAAEQRGWLARSLKAGAGATAGSILGAATGNALGLGAIEGAAGGMLAAEAARRGMPYAWRAAEGVSGLGSGPAVNPSAPLQLDAPMSRADLARLLGSPTGTAALLDHYRRRVNEKGGAK